MQNRSCMRILSSFITALIFVIIAGFANAEILSLGGSRVEVVNGTISDQDAKRVIRQFQTRYQRQEFEDRDLEKLIKRYNGPHLPNAQFLLGKMKFMKKSYKDSYNIFLRLVEQYPDNKLVTSGEVAEALEKATMKLMQVVEDKRQSYLSELDTLVKFGVLHRYVDGKFPKGFEKFMNKPYTREAKLNLPKAPVGGWYFLGKATKYSRSSSCTCCATFKNSKGTYQKREFPEDSKGRYGYEDVFYSYKDQQQAELAMMFPVFYSLFTTTTLPEAKYAIRSKLLQKEKLAQTARYILEPDVQGVQTFTTGFYVYNWKTLIKYSDKIDFRWKYDDSKCKEDLEDKIDWFQEQSRRNLQFLGMNIEFRIRNLDSLQVWRKRITNRLDGINVKFPGKAPTARVKFPSLSAVVKAKHGSVYDWVGLTKNTKTARSGGLI